MPKGWAFVPIGRLGILTRGSGIKRSEVIKEGYPCIRYGELYTTYKNSFTIAKSHIDYSLFKKCYKVHRNDIVMSLTGENKEDISKAVAYLGSDEIAMGGDMTCLSSHLMDPLYLVYAINSPYCSSIKRQLATGDIIVHMSNDRIASIGLPLPPLPEQKRITCQINKILQKINQFF